VHLLLASKYNKQQPAAVIVTTVEVAATYRFFFESYNKQHPGTTYQEFH